MTIIHCFTFGAAIEGVKGWKESRHCWTTKKYISQRSFCLSLFPVDCHPLQLWSFISYDRLGNSGRWTIDENMDICLIATSNMEKRIISCNVLKLFLPYFPSCLLTSGFFSKVSFSIFPPRSSPPASNALLSTFQMISQTTYRFNWFIVLSSLQK